MAATEALEKKWYYGNCHCAAVKFKVWIPSLEEHQVQTCNCSICSRNGYIHVYADRSDIVYLKGEESMKGYYFGEKRAEHKFCPECGSSLSVDPHGRFGTADWCSINVRMLQDIELDQLKFKDKTFDGKAMAPAYDPK